MSNSYEFDPELWAGPDSEIGSYVAGESRKMLNAYGQQPRLVEEHANIERATAQGGYGRRQIYELVQNGADALLGVEGHQIQVVLTADSLYCANEGEPITADGVGAILLSHISKKRGMEIGRFGLGFKSVLEVSRRPEFYSWSGSFGFDADETARVIREIAPDAERWPVLRFAFPLDARAAANDDPVLRELMSWAVTVVKLPRTEESQWLPEDLERFPAEFLLFSSHVGQLVLDDRTRGIKREIQLENEDGLQVLTEGSVRNTWQVFKTSHSPSSAAKGDAGELANRDVLPLAWAVPMEGRHRRGRFWAFFPTENETTLAGILNAPWKTNEDRQNLLTGTFNEELLAAFAELVAQHLEDIRLTSDPGSILDILPARIEQAYNWADLFLNEETYQRASGSPSLPDQWKILRTPTDMRLHPDGIGREVLQVWSNCEGRSRNWCDSSVQTKDRRYRADRLMELAGVQAEGCVEWIEALFENGGATVRNSIDALDLTYHLLQTSPDFLDDVRMADFILTEAGTLTAPITGEVFLKGPYDPVESDFEFVHHIVAQDERAVRGLEALGIKAVDAVGELRSFLFDARWSTPDWSAFWVITRRAGVEQSMEVLSTHQIRVALRARSVAGQFRPLSDLLLPGPIVPEDGSRDSGVALDVGFHEDDLALLMQLGVAGSPTPNGGGESEPWFAAYRSEAINEFEANVTGPSNPQRDFLQFKQSRFPGPLAPLMELSVEGSVRLTESVLGLMQPGDDTAWLMEHQTQAHYGKLEWLAPHVWMIRENGFLRTSRDDRLVVESVGPGLSKWARILPVANCTAEIAELLALPMALSELDPGAWESAFRAIEGSNDDVELGEFYAAASSFDYVPAALWCRAGDDFDFYRPDEVAVVCDQREFRALRAQSVPAILTPDPDSLRRIVAVWGLKEPGDVVSIEVAAVPSESGLPLVDVFPPLRWLLEGEARDLLLVRCSELRLKTLSPAGTETEEADFRIDSDRIYARDSLSDIELLRRVNVGLRLALTEEELLPIVESRSDEKRRKLIHDVRKGGSEGGRLLKAVGGERIKRRLPAPLLDAVEAARGSLSDSEIADLAFSVYGVDLLHEFRAELEDSGLTPPTQWAGSRAAREFVRELGFPREFAGFAGRRRDPLLEVDGPSEFPNLHDFQAEIKVEFLRLLSSQNGKRGLLSLPTGAGKTRVAVESIVTAMREGRQGSPVLWVADREELCEQAVQTWHFVWRAIGSRDRLSISRLWSGNEAEPVEGHQIVVASIGKLLGCMEKESYDWLAKAACIVIDEAHGAIAPQFTKFLAWQNMDRSRERAPLIGLTATPFRGVNEEETKRLVNRFGGRRLDTGTLGEDPYGYLQKLGVLARVEHEVLEGSSIELTDDELAHLEKLRRIPSSVDERLGADHERNRSLVDSVLGLPKEWTVLMFATSVTHAQTLAALLAMEGVATAAISAETDPGARRHYIESFRTGEVKVLTNYGVLTQGFDAPSVRAIYVARPTYSANLYQQMIGRGLRGPLNGGKERCRIVTVADNLERYGEQLAFTHFEHLWNEQA